MTPDSPHSPDTQALIDQAAQLGAERAARLTIAGEIAGGILASQGWPWTDKATPEQRAERADWFGARVQILTDALLGAMRTRTMTDLEVRMAVVMAADAAHETQ